MSRKRSIPELNRTRQVPAGLSWMAVLLALIFCLPACAPKTKVRIPVYREEPRGQVSPIPPPATLPGKAPMQQEEPAVIRPDAVPELPSGAARLQLPPGRVGTLLASATKAMQAGRLARAEMYLERALRLAPQETRLWHTMARVRFEQGNYSQAVQLCLKSNSLAEQDGAIVHQNWLLMEKAFLKSGEKEKATQARQKAAEKF